MEDRPHELEVVLVLAELVFEVVEDVFELAFPVELRVRFELG